MSTHDTLRNNLQRPIDAENDELGVSNIIPQDNIRKVNTTNILFT
ncbi:hypothetical protein [Alicyclobacillus mengziensis]|nr:hypothetical protein [Alicyclobacillus mengziensis]